MNVQARSTTNHEEIQFSEQVAGKPLRIGEGFEALSFKHDQFKGLMDPLVMLDHYTMSSPTFGAHPHAGMSALSILFEDSEGLFNNRDSLGNDIDLLPGDTYWLKAGSGAVHDEKPSKGSRTHGLQIFINLPQRHKHDAPASLHVSSSAIPVVEGDGYRVRVVMGESNGTQGATSQEVSPEQALTVLDTFLEGGSTYTHEVSGKQSLLLYSVSGEIKIKLDEHEFPLAEHHLTEHHAIAMQVEAGTKTLSLSSEDKAHVVVFQGTPLQEPFIQKGPFVMSNINEINKVTEAYQAGLLGSIAK